MKRGKKGKKKKKEKLSPWDTGINLSWNGKFQAEQQNTVFYYNRKYKINKHEFILV